SIVTNCVLINNSAFASGGGASGGTLNNCTIIGNHAASNSGGVAGAVLNNCIICSNSASLGGGANSCQLYNCTIMGNQADQGGGTYNSTLVNCMITGNSANASGFGGGGGAYQSMLFNCTVTGNRAYGSQGGGTYNSTLYNSIVYYNTSFTSYPNYAGGLLNNCCATPLPASGGGNVANDPLFVNQTGGDFHLQTNSPCINSGNNGYASGTDDLDGNPRIVGGTVDIGAYEFQAPVSRISYAWLQQYKLPINTNTDSSDADGDGMNNWQEWIAGTDPTNPSSVLEMLAPASTNNPSGLVVSWQSVNTRTYYLQRSTNLTAEPAFSSIQSNIVGQAGTTSYMDTNASGSGPCFYRVGVQ
ncbi:MAG: thrombospondin type 3 repeat-containing protein, partial [Verrucomicrobiota bacterium]